MKLKQLPSRGFALIVLAFLGAGGTARVMSRRAPTHCQCGGIKLA